jgi:hypothetical protein
MPQQAVPRAASALDEPVNPTGRSGFNTHRCAYMYPANVTHVALCGPAGGLSRPCNHMVMSSSLCGHCAQVVHQQQLCQISSWGWSTHGEWPG